MRTLAEAAQLGGEASPSSSSSLPRAAAKDSAGCRKRCAPSEYASAGDAGDAGDAAPEVPVRPERPGGPKRRVSRQEIRACLECLRTYPAWGPVEVATSVRRSSRTAAKQASASCGKEKAGRHTSTRLAAPRGSHHGRGQVRLAKRIARVVESPEEAHTGAGAVTASPEPGPPQPDADSVGSGMPAPPAEPRSPGLCCTGALQRAPHLGPTEWLHDDHFTFVVTEILRPPRHVWVATPAQVALLQSGQDVADPQGPRDGCLRDLWDAGHVQALLLPINSDPDAGRRADAGLHWSLMWVRRAPGGDVCAQVHDSLTGVPGCTVVASQWLLRQLSQSRHWRAAPRCPDLRPHGLQRDGYQCGVFCLLLMHQLLRAESGQEMVITAAMAAQLRAKLCSLGA